MSKNSIIVIAYPDRGARIFFFFFCAGNNQNARAGSGEGSWEMWRVWRVDMKEGGGGEVGRGAMGKGRLGVG